MALHSYKHKTSSLVWTSGPPLAGDVMPVSDVDFYIDNDMLHIADIKASRKMRSVLVADRPARLPAATASTSSPTLPRCAPRHRRPAALHYEFIICVRVPCTTTAHQFFLLAAFLK